MKFIIVASEDEVIIDEGKKVKNLEKTSSDFLIDFTSSLQKIGKETIIYSNTNEFKNNINKHKDDVVINFDFGYKSRIRNMRVPALCELHGISCFNPDPYVQILCQDKYMTKKYAESFGIKSPKSVLVFCEEHIEKILKSLQFPIIIKPNYESESIGITQKNIVKTFEKAEKLIKELLKEFNQAILVEEYIEGKEIAITICGNKNEVDLFYEIEIVFDGLKSGDFNAFTYEVKNRLSQNITTKKQISNYVKYDNIENLKKLFKSLETANIIRIDGRIKNEEFYLIEINANPGLSKNSIIFQTLKCYGYSYDDMIKKIFSKNKYN